MNHVERIIHSYFTMTVPAIVALFLLAAQCSGDNPPLPRSPSGLTLRLAILSPTEGELSPVGQMMRSGVIMALEIDVHTLAEKPFNRAGISTLCGIVQRARPR